MTGASVLLSCVASNLERINAGNYFGIYSGDVRGCAGSQQLSLHLDCTGNSRATEQSQSCASPEQSHLIAHLVTSLGMLVPKADRASSNKPASVYTSGATYMHALRQACSANGAAPMCLDLLRKSTIIVESTDTTCPAFRRKRLRDRVASGVKSRRRAQ